MKEYPQPKQQVTYSLSSSFVNLFSRFVPGCTKLLHLLPLQEILQTGEAAKLNLTHAANEAFGCIKQNIARATSLHHPKTGAAICLITDASDIAL